MLVSLKGKWAGDVFITDEGIICPLPHEFVFEEEGFVTFEVKDGVYYPIKIFFPSSLDN